MSDANCDFEQCGFDSDPITQFRIWYAAAQADGRIEIPEAMCLSTVDSQGWPDARIVLLKEMSDLGFVFFTNGESKKAEELAGNPRVSLTFYWEPLDRQVRIQGLAAIVSDGESDSYFATRPRQSQLAAWASAQSKPIVTRQELETRYAVYETQFIGQPVPRPPHWHGYRVTPQRIEFWMGKSHRLHDRFLYEHKGGRWSVARLNP
jgi:pyridoxamine 5'-phosphate oxidase